MCITSFIETENRVVVTRGCGQGRMGRCWSNFQLCSEDLMYSMAIVVNNSIAYLNAAESRS